jgi:hypothetical protein
MFALLIDEVSIASHYYWKLGVIAPQKIKYRPQKTMIKKDRGVFHPLSLNITLPQ